MSVVTGIECYKLGMVGKPVNQSSMHQQQILSECGKGMYCSTWIRIYDGFVVKDCASQKDCVYKREDCMKDGGCEYNCCKAPGCNAAPQSASPVSLMVLGISAAAAYAGRILF